MLTCRELTELVTDYLEGRLGLIERLAFQMHIGMCKHCRAYLRQMRLTVQTLGRMPDEPMPASVRDELLARFRNAQPRPGAPAGIPWSVRFLAAIERAVGSERGWALAALMLAAVLVLAATGLRPGPIDPRARCLLMELGAGGVFVAFLGVLASRQHARLSASTWTVVGMAGALVAFGALEAMCPVARVTAHVLIFHVGGVVLAGMLGMAASRLPALR